LTPATSSTFCRKATVAWFWFEWNGRSQNHGTKFESFAEKGNTHCFPSAGRFRARKSSKRSNSFRRDLPALCQHADCGNPPKAFGVKTSAGLRLGCAAHKPQPARLANWASCESAPKAFGVGLSRTIFHCKESTHNREAIYRFVSRRISRKTSNETGDARRAHFPSRDCARFLKPQSRFASNKRKRRPF